MVMDRVAGPVVDGVEQLVVAKRDVADGEVEPALGETGGGEALGTDLGPGVQGRGYAGSDGVKLDPHGLYGQGRWCGGQEGPRTDARLEYPPAGKTRCLHCAPHGDATSKSV
jgi:hypothetical protein